MEKHEIDLGDDEPAVFDTNKGGFWAGAMNSFGRRPAEKMSNSTVDGVHKGTETGEIEILDDPENEGELLLRWYDKKAAKVAVGASVLAVTTTLAVLSIRKLGNKS